MLIERLPGMLPRPPPSQLNCRLMAGEQPIGEGIQQKVDSEEVESKWLRGV